MIDIPEELIQQIHLHGERIYPEECCGMMLGIQHDRLQIVQTILPIDNSQEANRQRRFLITPEQYRNAEKNAIEMQLDLLGFYHSHPDHPAVPSAFDSEHALPWFTYVIVSIIDGKARTISAWVLSEDRQSFDERPLNISRLLKKKTTKRRERQNEK